MKKVINSLFVIIAAMVTFAGCAEQEIDAPATSETKTVQFFANSIETKTVFGTPNDGVYPTLWSAGDEVKVLLNIEQVAGTEAKVPVTCDDLAVSSTFEASFQPKDTPETYTYYAVCPANQYNAKSSKDGRITVIIPSEQEPLETTVDKKAQIIYAVATADAEQGSVDMDFHHLTAYGKLTLKNLPEDISVSEVKIVAPDDLYISGKWNYLVADGSIAAHKEATMNTLTIKTTRTTDIWFACGPVDVSGKTLTLTVTTNQGDFVKELNFPANRKFEAGKISKFTVDMTGITAGGTDEPEQPGETTAYYEKVTSAPADWSGKYLVVFGNNAHATLSSNNKDFVSTIEVSINDDRIPAYDEYEKAVMTVTKSGDKYNMTYPDGKYFSMAHNISASSDTPFDLEFTYTDDGVKIIGYVTAKSAYYILYHNNNNGNYYRCYVDKNGQNGYALPILYRLSEGNNGSETPEPEQPKTLVSIAVADNAKTEYTVDDEFVKPAVTATYDDASTADVTANATFTGYDMSKAETQEVTVSYTEGEVTKTATYTITITAAEEPEEPSGPIVATIEQFLDAEDSETVWYQLTGKISNIANTTYGNFDLTDETGTVFVYGLKASKDAENKTFSSLGLKVGDTVTLIGNRDTYVNENNGTEKDEVTNAYYVSHVPAPYLTVSTSDLSVAATATSAEFTVDTNVEWTVSCSTATATKSGNKVTVAFVANETAEAVVHEVVVTSELGNKTVTITQAAASQGGGDEGELTPSNTPCYTLTTSNHTGGDQGYATASDINAGGITWNVTGNSTMAPWRIGGKSLSKTDRNVFTKTAYSSELSKIEFISGTLNVTSWNSLTLVYSTNSDFSNSQTMVASSVGENKTIEFSPEGGFPANCYYKFILNITVSGSKNKYVELQEIRFYGYEN